MSKGLNVEAIAGADLKIEEPTITVNKFIETFPERNTKGVHPNICPRVTFKDCQIKPSTLTNENVYLVDKNRNRVSCTVEIISGQTVAILPDSPLEPLSTYYFHFGNKMRDTSGKKFLITDNSICFTTAAE